MKLKQKRRRSPNYPAFALDKAIKKIEILYERDGKAGAPKKLALQYWGYESEVSGSALRTLSTLRGFGLIIKKEARIVPSESALDIIIYAHDKARVSQALRVAALKPNLYKDLYEKYHGGWPSPEALGAELEGDYDFNPKQVDRFIKDFFATLKYAGLFRPERSTEVVRPVKTEQKTTITTVPPQPAEQGVETQSPTEPMGQKSYCVTLETGEDVQLVLPKIPVKQSDVERLKNFIDLMEPVWTKGSDPQE